MLGRVTKSTRLSLFQPTIIPTEQQEFSIGEADALQSAIQGYTEAAEKREAQMPNSAEAMAKQRWFC